MMLTRTKLLRAIGAFTLPAAAVFAAVLSASDARAQQASSSEQLLQLMTHRQEMSNRAVRETMQRRFEDKKTDGAFPSDSTKAIKGGVVPALTPEELKALQHNERGLEFFSKGKLDDAIKEYHQAIRLDPKLAAAHNNLGSAYFAGGRFEEAAVAFRHAGELDTDYGQAFFNLALAQIKLGHEKEANQALDASLRAYVSAGDAHLKAGRLKDAEEAFRGMLQIDPEYVPALLRLALVFDAAGRHEEAALNLRRVIVREAGNYIAYQLLAEALYGQQKYEEAAAAAERALKLSPGFPDACYQAGLARAALGQRDAALTHLDRLRQLNSPDLAQQLSEFIDKKAPATKSKDER